MSEKDGMWIGSVLWLARVVCSHLRRVMCSMCLINVCSTGVKYRCAFFKEGEVRR